MRLANTFVAARAAAQQIRGLGAEKLNEVLLALADEAELRSDFMVEQNRRDLERTSPENPMYDRLLLDSGRIAGIASDLRKVASLATPAGVADSEFVHANGMKISKVRQPFGVVGVIYEARPNVTFDVFSLCLKTCNACVLKGGSDAQFTNAAIVEIIKEVLMRHGVAHDVISLLPPDREATAELLGAVGYVDLLIPRGSSSLINFVRDNARVPVIETGAGIVHTYFDRDGDLEKGADIVFNSKTRRVSVCNALDCLIINRGRLADLPALCERLATKNVVIYADPEASAALEGKYPQELLKTADETSYGTEFLDYKMSVKTVDSLEEAVEHIAKYSSKHSEAIVTENIVAKRYFELYVDAACVYWNVSTAFTDGAQFGLGAEVGISTQKLHARGPMGLRELTTYKYIIEGNGQTRS